MMITTLLMANVMVQHQHSAPQFKVKTGKYEVTLRLPEEGLYSQEETDVEFRVVDTTQKDPVEEGFKGVGAIDASATLTMPSMPGMPNVKPTVHREGVPGDYGVVLYFAHGGDYKLDLSLKIPNDEVKKVSFMVPVKDERPQKSSVVLPYRLSAVNWLSSAQAGRQYPLNLQVINTKTKAVQTQFDTAHERKFHLLIVSKDLNWFRHEHPVMAANGTWTQPITFPAGGEYWVYGDVAPTGKGSQVLRTSVKVSGPAPTWNTKASVKSVGIDGNLQGWIEAVAPIQIGKSATIRIRLSESRTMKPTAITETYLGALGHLMIFSKDGQTVVHSHPVEGKASEEQAKKGAVSFTARFPKPGYYKAYAQFNWQGKIHTLGFGLMVK